MQAAPFRHRFLVLAAAALFSTGGAAIKAVDLTGLQIACFRSGVAALCLLTAIPEARRGWHWRMVPVAAAYAATLIPFVLANRLTTAANAIFLQSAAPLYLLLLGPLLLREPVTRRDIAFMAPVLAGIVIFFAGSEPAHATAPDPKLGNVFAVISGVTYALMLAGLRWLSRKEQGNTAVATVALGNVIASLAVLPWAFPVVHAGIQDAAVVLYLGAIQIALSYVCLTRGIRHVSALEVSTLLMVEPALSPVWAWLVHGEVPGRWALLGGVTILTATMLNTWRRSRVT